MKTRLFKNKEVRRFTFVCAAIGAAACAGAYLLHPYCALVCAVLTLLLIGAFLFFTAKRYSALAELSTKLDRLMSGGESVDLSKYSEGELSILENRLSKLVSCLRDQADVLQKDKLLLADSIADISHQIKTPLTSLNLLSASLARQIAAEDAVEGADGEQGAAAAASRQKTLSDMRAQIERMDWLVSALLKLARLDADAVKLKAECVPLDELIRLSASPLEIMMELKGQQLEVNANGGAICDASWTAEALMNIMKNCSESMGEGVLRVQAEENPLYSEIVITDCGGGIDGADLPYIFERFHRGKNASEGGAGIGLALARSIIVKQNGTVKAENALQGGARFTVRFYKGTV
ncbi:MAG: HAMP domain-containing histidine kinase [Clostridia bacterium]|nr:HAMP domain-containing histidine kinase [Clostridia bacterium]